MRKSHGKLKRIYKRIDKGFHRYINGTKGVISLFLAILMVPFATIAGSLINAARINSAVAVFDEALCNASNSTLGTYDEFLRKRFGLLAMSQNTASYGSGYTVQDLISETFEFYMEQNLGALSNTYTNYDVSATGVYPLADTDVLLSQVLEAGKYTVPTKLVIDGLSLDDLLSQLTKSLNVTSSIFNTLSAGAGMVDKFTQCEEKLDALSDKIAASETARTEYDAAYNAFATAVNNYNNLIDEIKEKINEKQTAVNNAQTKVGECEVALETEAEKIPDLVQVIEDWENEEDEHGNKVDNSEKIKDFKEEHKEEMADYLEAEEALEKANEELESAQTALNNVISSYSSSLSSKRSAVTSAKSTYVQKIEAFASALQATGNAVIAAQSSVTAAINSGVSLAGNITSTIYESQKESIDNQIKDMEKSRDAAAERGDDTAKYLWQDKIDELKEQKTELNNENKVSSAYTSATSTAVSSLNSFTSEDYQGLYADAYGRLISLKTSVQSYVVSTDSTTKLASASSYYETISTILSEGDVQKLQENLASEVASSSFFALVKAIVGFVKAIFTLTAWYDPELSATINTDNYSSIGGLPSTKDRSDGSAYSLKSPYADVDQQKSDYYKDLLGEYSNNPAVTGSATTMANVIETITNSINTISDCCDDWHWYNVFSNLGKIISAIGDIITNVISFVANLVEIVVNAVYQKALLTGYIAYNIPNRTTYTGSALTGSGYALPNLHSSNQGYAFYGAETEYIIHGSLSETDNQSSLFNIIYLLRLVFDIASVATNSEVATLAGEAGAATFGIGTVVVYILYFIAEPFVDTLILVNSGTIPVIKTKVFLTPSGIPDLISRFLKLSLTEAQKNTAYQKIIKVASLGQASDSFATNYADAISSGIADPDMPGSNLFTETWEFDYTKTLIIIMMLFTSTDTMVSRLADIIQMECSYDAVNRIDAYTFDLDKSYTYLRAAGTFETNEFIKISNGTGLNSKERVVYRGY